MIIRPFSVSEYRGNPVCVSMNKSSHDVVGVSCKAKTENPAGEREETLGKLGGCFSKKLNSSWYPYQNNRHYPFR